MKTPEYDKINSHGWLLAIVTIVALGLLIQFRFMNEFPAYIHAWAQDDRYAIAINFLNDDFDLFHPETMIYNKQFPDWWQTASDNTITAVDFPIHEYIIAILMKIFGTSSPIVFRTWTLLCSFVGLFFLYKIGHLITGDWIKSIFVTIIAMTAPVYAYYFNGFLPGIPAFAFGLVGLWAYLKYIRTDSLKFFHTGVGFITLSMLMRTTFAIELIAILCFEMLRIFRKESRFLNKLPSVIISAIVFIAYFIWNSHLRKEYGSLFLSDLLPAANLEDAKDILKDAKNNWEFQYFQKSQYHTFITLTVIAIISGIYRRIKTKKDEPAEKVKQPTHIVWLPLIYIFGCLLFTIAMMKQLPNHDYYFIDTFFMPFLMLFALLLSAFPKASSYKSALISIVIFGAISTFMIQKVQDTQTERRWDGDRALHSYMNFIDSDKFLDSLNVPADAKILSLYSYPQNGSFIQMQRKGYTIMELHKPNVTEASAHWDIDYVVVENEIFAQYFDERPEILSRLKKIASNGRISLCTLSDTVINKSVSDF